MTKAIARHGEFIVEKSDESQRRYNVVHCHVRIPAMKRLPKDSATEMAVELANLGLTGQTMKELTASPVWNDALLIAKKFAPLSDRPKEKKI